MARTTSRRSSSSSPSIPRTSEVARARAICSVVFGGAADAARPRRSSKQNGDDAHVVTTTTLTSPLTTCLRSPHPIHPH